MKPARIVMLIVAVAVLLLAVAGPGSRFGLWDFRTGFTLLRWALYLGVAGAALALIALVFARLRRGHVAGLVVALLAGLAVAFVPWRTMQIAHSVPPIHDISTDTADPPQFESVLRLRADAPNPPGYEGEPVAKQQREAYPDIQPLQLEVAPGTAYERALAAAESMGWEIIGADPRAGRIEATATTLWFGFKDDVVVRIRATEGGGSVVDVRSKSRVGRSDLGANAARIRDYLARLR